MEITQTLLFPAKSSFHICASKPQNMAGMCSAHAFEKLDAIFTVRGIAA
jgi:hypothetical protein